MLVSSLGGSLSTCHGLLGGFHVTTIREGLLVCLFSMLSCLIGCFRYSVRLFLCCGVVICIECESLGAKGGIPRMYEYS